MNSKVYNLLLMHFNRKKDISNPIESIYLSKIISKFAFTHYCGHLYSEDIENFLNKISQEVIKIDKIDKIYNNEILHVFTSVHSTGGHTRLALNWIKNSFDEEKHSILLLEQLESEIPEFFKKDGLIKDIYSYKQYDILDKAKKLREISFKYKYIVFHINMDDPVANLAFGHNKDLYSTIFMNHADHIFFLGNTSSKYFAELSSSGQEISLFKRNINNSSILPIPLNPIHNPVSKMEARSKLGIDNDIKIFISIASPYKFIPDGEIDFFKVSEEIIKRVENSKIIVIGPDKKLSKEWMELFTKTDGKVDAIGYVIEDLYLYHNACDVFLDCLPWSSYTAELEVALLGKPCVTMDYGFKEPIDSIKESDFVVSNISEYIQKAINSLLIGFNQIELNRNTIESYHIKKGWQKYLKSIYYNMDNNIKFNCNKSNEQKQKIIERFEKFSQDNLKNCSEYFFIKKIKRELKYLSFFNRFLVVKILSKNYNFKMKLKAYLYLLRSVF